MDVGGWFRMARRYVWLLLHLTLGAAALPGCSHTLLGRLGDKDCPCTASDEPAAHPKSFSTATPSRPEIQARSVSAEVTQQTSNKLARTEDVIAAQTPARAPSPRSVPAQPTGFGTPGTVRITQPEKEPPPTIVVPKAAPRAPLVEALQCMLDDRHQEALKHLRAYDQETQEIFLRILPPLTVFARKRLDQLAPQEVAVLNDQLCSLLTTLRPRTELAIDRLCFVRQVKGYGLYDPLPPGHAFLAPSGRALGDLVVLYVELRNFCSEERRGGYETQLNCTAIIRDAKGNLRKRLNFNGDRRATMHSRTRKHDLHDVCCFYVPPDLEPGTYQLTLEVIDETIPELRRSARKTIAFRVTAVAGQPAPR